MEWIKPEIQELDINTTLSGNDDHYDSNGGSDVS